MNEDRIPTHAEFKQDVLKGDPEACRVFDRLIESSDEVALGAFVTGALEGWSKKTRLSVLQDLQAAFCFRCGDERDPEDGSCPSGCDRARDGTQ